MWEARATYADGTEICQYFADNGNNENDQQYELKCWLIERDKVCTWYSVNWIDEDDEEA